MFANSMGLNEILSEYPDLGKDDVFEALACAAEAVEGAY